MASSSTWAETSLSILAKTKGQGRAELVAYSGHADTDRELPAVQAVSAHLATRNCVSKFGDCAAHQLQPPKAVHSCL